MCHRGDVGSAVLRLQYHCVYTLSVVLFLALFSGLRVEWVGADAWGLGSNGTTWCIHGPNHPLTVSPRCPGWPGSPSFPAGPWSGGWGGRRSRQFIKDLGSWVQINISKAHIKSVTVDLLQTVLPCRLWQQLLTFGPLGPGKPTGPCGPWGPLERKESEESLRINSWTQTLHSSFLESNQEFSPK